MNNIMMVKKLFLVFLFLVVLSSFTSAVGGDFFINHVTGGDGLLVVDIGGLSFQGNGFVASTPPTLPTGGSSGAGADVDGPLFTKYFFEVIVLSLFTPINILQNPILNTITLPINTLSYMSISTHLLI